MTDPTPPVGALEAIDVDTRQGWHRPAGFPEGIEMKLLADDLDEQHRRGARTRLVRVAPGVRTEHILTHPYWEEVFLLSGDFTRIADAGERTVRGLSYSRRPPGTPHGPFQTQEGCMLLEVQYFAA